MSRGMPRSTDAINNPAISSGITNMSEKEIGQGTDRTLRSTGDAKTALEESSLIKVMEQPYDDEKMKMLAFMNEPVTIRIATTTDRNAEQIFELDVANRRELFRRGETKTVPRFMVDRMLRMKETRYEQREVLNQEGIRDYLHVPHTGLKYDFAIVNDANPLGPSWERAVLAEPG